MSAVKAHPSEYVEWLNGPAVAKWLVQDCHVHHLDIELGNSGARRVREWAKGAAASVWSLDCVLTRIGLHLLDVPDEIWKCGERRRFTRKFSAETRRWALRELAKGRGPTEVAKEIGASPDTIHSWRKAL